MNEKDNTSGISPLNITSEENLRTGSEMFKDCRQENDMTPIERALLNRVREEYWTARKCKTRPFWQKQILAASLGIIAGVATYWLAYWIKTL